MLIGVPREILSSRVSGRVWTPVSVREFVVHGHKVVVEIPGAHGAARGSCRC
jgi:alanine dehydrogenase